jgi:hypothetical protein
MYYFCILKTNCIYLSSLLLSAQNNSGSNVISKSCGCHFQLKWDFLSLVFKCVELEEDCLYVWEVESYSCNVRVSLWIAEYSFLHWSLELVWGRSVKLIECMMWLQLFFLFFSSQVFTVRIFRKKILCPVIYGAFIYY